MIKDLMGPFTIRRHTKGVPFAVLKDGRYVLFGGRCRKDPVWYLDPDQFDPGEESVQAMACTGVWVAVRESESRTVLKQTGRRSKAVLYLWSPGCPEEDAGFYTDGTVVETETWSTYGTAVRSRLVLCRPGERLLWMNGSKRQINKARIAGVL